MNTMNPKNPNQTMKTLKKYMGSCALVLAWMLFAAAPAMAAETTQYDDVFINGYKLGFFEQMALEDHIDRDIPDGNYWFDLNTGLWGPKGGPAIGQIQIPEDYREYVESKLNNTSQATQVELSASTEECDTNCLYW